MSDQKKYLSADGYELYKNYIIHFVCIESVPIQGCFLDKDVIDVRFCSQVLNSNFGKAHHYLISKDKNPFLVQKKYCFRKLENAMKLRNELAVKRTIRNILYV